MTAVTPMTREEIAALAELERKATRALVDRLYATVRRVNDGDYHTESIIGALEDAADAIDRLTRERDEARAVLAAADKGTPIYRAVERVLDEHSAWIAGSREDVTKAIALAAGVAWMAAEKVDPSLAEIDAALAAAQAENARLRTTNNATSARFERLAAICRRVRWTEIDTPAMTNDDTRAALGDLAEWLFAEGVDKALAARAALAHGGPRDGE